MIREEIKKNILIAIEKIGIKNIPSFVIDPPENPNHGDYATNVALLLARQLNKSPRDVAQELVARLQKSIFKKVDVAGPGFINMWLDDHVFENNLQEIIKKKDAFGRAKKRKEKIQVEFISANPTGPLTLANGRGGFWGDVLSRALEYQGYSVEREYYINDSGNQVITLGHSVMAAGGYETWQEGFYKGPHIDEWAQKNKTFLKKHSTSPEKVGKAVARDFLKKFIHPAVEKKMKIRFDRWTSEEAIKKKYLGTIQLLLKKRGLVYQKEGAVWLKTTEFGDDKDRVIITSDGFPTYFFLDAAHYLDTKKRGFVGKINILGADHHGYVSRIQAMAKIVGLEKSYVLVMQLVHLFSEGKEVRMSKRKGNFITIDELIDEVGLDPVRYFFLEKSPDTHVDFDMELAKEHSAKNPVYYIQYAHARMSSILLKTKNQKPLPSRQVGKTKNQKKIVRLLSSVEERELLKKLLQFQEVIEDTAHDYHVHRLPRFALNLARAFHDFYEKHRVISEDSDLTAARVSLITATSLILRSTLSLLGISAPKKM